MLGGTEVRGVMNAFKLGIALVWHKKTWAIALMAMVLVPILFPYLTPYEYNNGVLQPARAQAAWGIALTLGMLWGLYVAADLGAYFRRTQLADYFYSTGVSKLRLMGQCWLVPVICIVPLVLLAVLVCLLFCTPSHFFEAKLWRQTNLQFATCYLLTFLPLSALALALSNRFSALIGYMVSVGLAVYGFYGVGYLEQLLQKQTIPFLDFIWHISPHYHVGDLTSRLVFKMGSLTGSVFFQTSLYLLAVGIFLITGAIIIFRGKMQRTIWQFICVKRFTPALLLLSLILFGVSNVSRQSEVNPLSVFGSAYGKTIAMGMQSPIELIWHEGANDHHEEAENLEAGELHMHVVEKKVDYPNNLKGFITHLDDQKKARTNPLANRKLHRSFIRGTVERKIKLAWRMDPAHYDNYANYHFFLTESGVAERERNYQHAISIAEQTLHHCRRHVDDPQAMITASAAAQNVVDVMLTFQQREVAYDTCEPWFAVAQEHLERGALLVSSERFPYPPSYRESMLANLKRLQAVQQGLITKSQELSAQL